MESPRIHGGAEEKTSCESGWTMYIEDTFHGNHHRSDVVYQDYDDDGDFRVKDDGEDDGEDDGGDDDDGDDDSSENESDDSMTSDASSWPSYQIPRNTKNHAAAAKIVMPNKPIIRQRVELVRNSATKKRNLSSRLEQEPLQLVVFKVEAR